MALDGDAEGLGVGTPTRYVGTRVGDAVGADEGEADGLGVGTPGVYVGTRVGAFVGARVGNELGLGVGALTAYVGARVGAAVGATLGADDGCGVGTPAVCTWWFVTVTVTVAVAVAARLRVTEVSVESVLETAEETTTEPEAMELVAATVAPVLNFEASDVSTVMTVEPAVVVA